MERLNRKYYYRAYESDYENVLKKMPKIFTSQLFGMKARAAGVPGHILLKGDCAKFLHTRHDVEHLSKFSWRKKKYKETDLCETKSAASIEEMIQILKSRGYRIYKPITDYKEI